VRGWQALIARSAGGRLVCVRAQQLMGVAVLGAQQGHFLLVSVSFHRRWCAKTLLLPCRISALSQKFYRDYYHPSNARFWFYGDDAGGCLADVCWAPLFEPTTCPSSVRDAAVLPVHCQAISSWLRNSPRLVQLAELMVLANPCSSTHANFPCCSLQWRSGCACWTLTCPSLRRGPWTRAWRPSRCSRWVVQLEGRETCLVGAVQHRLLLMRWKLKPCLATLLSL